MLVLSEGANTSVPPPIVSELAGSSGTCYLKTNRDWVNRPVMSIQDEPEPRQKIHKTSMEHLVVQESKGVLKQTNIQMHNEGRILKEPRNQLR